MCGIIGVLARRPAAPLILDALKRLEYRGYDSAGVATLAGGRLHRLRTVGKLAALEAALAADPLPGEAGVGHTRWATHGAPTEANAHPHVAGRVAVVHNGIVENWRPLRAELEAAGAVFTSDTDTEVVAHLCARALDAGAAPFDAVRATVARLHGAFALAFLFEGAEDLLIAARHGAPLAVGWGEGEMFVASDALALGPLTRRVTYLEDGDCAAVTRAGARLFDAAGRTVERAVHTLAASAVAVDKGGRRHFMAKEIHEQPAVAAAAVAAGPQAMARVGAAVDWAGLPRITLVGCGTAYYACLAAGRWFETQARLHAAVDVASEFRYREPPLPPGGVAIFVSQSGETADTLAALRYARAVGQTAIAVVNVETSSIAREADLVLPILAGPEIGVASTKAFMGQLIALAWLAFGAARARGALDAAAEARLTAAMATIPGLVADALAVEPAAAGVAAEIAAARSALYIGRGVMHALAMEGALKLKELSYIHAEGFAAGELKHGPIALVDERTPIVALAPSGALFDKTLSNIQEVAARRGRVVLLTDAAGAQAAGPEVWRTLVLPTCDPFVAPMIHAPALQLLAYHAAVARGADVDQPRNLAKSVTVE